MFKLQNTNVISKQQSPTINFNEGNIWYVHAEISSSNGQVDMGKISTIMNLPLPSRVKNYKHILKLIHNGSIKDTLL